MYNHLFGPVPSRRLGMSLGIDLIPYKVCTLDCVYCECGETTTKTVQRDEYVPIKEVKEELVRYFKENPPPDYLTFSGSGEPTLNSGIGEIINFLKARWPSVPVAVLTNGTLLSDPRVRQEILKADLVLPSLDAGSFEVFKKLNRPEESIDLTEYLKGLVKFRRKFKGTIWLEVFILPGYNDTKEELSLLGEAIKEIQPESVQLNTLDRPGAVPGLVPASKERLEEILRSWKKELGGDTRAKGELSENGKAGTDTRRGSAQQIEVEIIAAATRRKELTTYRRDMETAILETISRRPCTLEDIADILGIHINEVNKYLGVLEEEGKIVTREETRGTFYGRNT